MKKYNDTMKYLRSEDLLSGGKYKTLTLEIADVVADCPMWAKSGMKSALGLQFKGAQKVLGLGITNEGVLKTVLGDASPETWKGKNVTLEVRTVRAATGGTTPVIRIMPPKGTKLRAGLARQLGEAIA